LGVRYVLEGSVRKVGSRVRVTAQLIEAATGGHLWAERYDRDLADIFSVQDEITTNVSEAIQPALERSERERAARKPPDSLDAWESYHRGMWHFANVEASENENARSFFRRAIEIDPRFAPPEAAHISGQAVRVTRSRRCRPRCASVPSIRSSPSGYTLWPGHIMRGRLCCIDCGSAPITQFGAEFSTNLQYSDRGPRTDR